MHTAIAHTEKSASGPVVNADKHAETTQPRVKVIRLDRHILRAEWAERLRGRS